MKKILALLMIFPLLLTFLLFSASCGKDKNETETPEESAFVSEVLVNSFEGYSECYDLYGSTSAHYAVNFKKHDIGVTDGERAAHVTGDPVEAGTQKSYVVGVQVFETNSEENNYRDFSKAQSVTFDVYNDGENPLTITTTLMKKVGGYAYSSAQTVTIESKTAQQVTYVVNRYELFYSIGISGTTHVNVTFKGVDVSAYIDNMRIHYIDDEFVAPEIDIDKDEIIGFEKSYQTFAVTSTGSILKPQVVADAEQASVGNRYLRVTRDGVKDGVASYGDGKVIIPANYLNKINFSKYAKTAYIAYDYKCCWVGNNLWFCPRLVSSEYGGYANVQGASLVAGNEWHTQYVPIDFIPKGFDTIELCFEGGTYGDVCFDNFRVVTELPANVDMNYVATKYSI